MLVELIDRILDKGIVIDAWARVSLLGIELLTIEARIVVASVDTYLRYAEAISNTALASMPQPRSVQQARSAVDSGQQQGLVGGPQAQGLPAPQQQNLMPQRHSPQQPAQQPTGVPAQSQQARPQPPQPPQPVQPQQSHSPQQPQPPQAPQSQQAGQQGGP
jgi:hypothetical protein